MTIPEPQLDDLYREVILDHYKNPRGKEPVIDPHVSNKGFNPVCGDEVKVAFRVDGDKMGDLEVQGRGCSISVASGSIMAEHLRGKPLKEVRKVYVAFKALMHGETVDDDVDIGELEALEGVKKFPVRIKCALLPWVTLGDALEALEEGRNHPKSVSNTEREEESGSPDLVRIGDDRPGIPCDTDREPHEQTPPGRLEK